MRPPQILADGWYSWWLPDRAQSCQLPHFLAFTDLISTWPDPLRGLILRIGAVRGLALAVASRGFPGLAVTRYDPGWRSLLLARAMFGRQRKLIVLQFLDHAPRSGGWGGAVDRMWRPVERWAIRRAMSVGQVLSPSEQELYAERFGTAPSRFRLVRFAWRLSPPGSPPPARVSDQGSTSPHSTGVLAIGRAHCDWDTVFAAAAGRDWNLTVVCSGAARPAVQELADRHGVRVQVHADVSHDQARALMADAAVCVICLLPGQTSRGQVRLCDATDAGTAVVITDLPALDGYVEPGATALLVPPREAHPLRDAVERLLARPELRNELARSAYERAESWTAQEYLRAIRGLAALPGGR